MQFAADNRQNMARTENLGSFQCKYIELGK